MYKKQSGVALITVMLILSLATITAVSMVSKQNIDIHRSANILNIDQALEMTVYIEGYAKKGLKLHFGQLNRTTTTSADIVNWNTSVFDGLTIDEIKSTGVGTIEDVQGRFNLNSLVNSSDSVEPLQQRRLMTLITNLNDDVEINLNLNPNFVDAVIDWIDFNQGVTGVNGAEDGIYTSLDPPYTTANQYMNDISELLLVNGIDYKQYEVLKEYVCVLNSTAAMNINTAKQHVLKSLNPAITMADAVDLYNNANSLNNGKGFDNPAAFVADRIISRLNISVAGLDVSSNHFDVKSEVERNDTLLLYTSRLFRNTAGNIDVIKRGRRLL